MSVYQNAQYKQTKLVGIQRFEPHPSFQGFVGWETDESGRKFKNENGVWGKRVQLLLSPNLVNDEVEVYVELNDLGMSEMNVAVNAHRIGTLPKGQLRTELLQSLENMLVDGYVYDYPRLSGKNTYSYQVIVDA